MGTPPPHATSCLRTSTGKVMYKPFSPSPSRRRRRRTRNLFQRFFFGDSESSSAEKERNCFGRASGKEDASPHRLQGFDSGVEAPELFEHYECVIYTPWRPSSSPFCPTAKLGLPQRKLSTDWHSRRCNVRDFWHELVRCGHTALFCRAARIDYCCRGCPHRDRNCWCSNCSNCSSWCS